MLLTLIANLNDQATRFEAANKLAQFFGGLHLFVFIFDPEIGIPLSAPGFPQTLPNGNYWRDFSRECANKGYLEGFLPYPDLKSMHKAMGFSGPEQSVIILLGGTPEREKISPLLEIQPILINLLTREFVGFSTQARIDAADKAVKKAEKLAATIDVMRTHLKDALVEAAAANDELLKIYKDLDQSRNDLLFTIKAAGLGTFDYNPLTNRFSGNEILKTWFGLLPSDEIELSEALNVIAEKDRTRVIQAIQQALNYSSGGVYDIEYTIVSPHSPTSRIVHAKGQATFNTEQQAIRLSGTLEDVTEERKSMAELEDAREQFSLIADNISQLAWMTDDTGYIFWYNKRWYDYTGTTFEEMKGWGWKKVHHPDHLAQVVEKWTANINSGEVFEMIFPLRSKEGEFRWFLTRAVPWKDENGKLLRWFGTNTDVTEQKADDERKNDFIAMASHELKTPLTSLSAIIQMLNNKLKNNADPFIVGGIGKANIQVRKMAAMINGFLNVSKLESGKIQLDKTKFDLEALLREVVSETEMTISTHDIQLENCEAVQVFADKHKIGSVISNLISNAVKYSPQGSKIYIKCRVIGSDAQVSIRDEGFGIKPQDQLHLFDRFYRVEDTNNKFIAGFGIGLYLSAEIVERHEGKIWVQSEIGIGSTFFFSIPLA